MLPFTLKVPILTYSNMYSTIGPTSRAARFCGLMRRSEKQLIELFNATRLRIVTLYFQNREIDFNSMIKAVKK